MHLYDQSIFTYVNFQVRLIVNFQVRLNVVRPNVNFQVGLYCETISKVHDSVFFQTGAKIDTRTKLKFSWFFKNVVVELDKEAYGPDNHLAEWHREANSEDIDGFTVRSSAASWLQQVCCLSYLWLVFSGDPSRRRDRQVHHSLVFESPGIFCFTHIHVHMRITDHTRIHVITLYTLTCTHTPHVRPSVPIHSPSSTN